MPRLGELLLAENAITPAELDSALQNHVLHGVTLATCLVEMGYVSDKVVARCLGKQTGCAFLTKDQLIAAGGQNLSILSPATVKKLRLVPAGITGGTLRIATDHDISAIKLTELEKIVSRKIELLTVSGYAMDCFLEQMFGVPRPGRFLPKNSRHKGPVEQPPVAIDKSEANQIVIDGVEWRPLGETTQTKDSTLAYDDIFNMPLNIDTPPQTLPDAAEHFSHARSRDDVAKTVLDFITRTAETAALLIIKDEVVTGWRANAHKRDIPNFEAFSAPLETLPDLQQCVDSKKPYFGRCSTPESELIWHTLHYRGGMVAYFPIFIRQQVVAVLLCNESDTLNPIETAELCRKASYALEILILRSKLLG